MASIHSNSTSQSSIIRNPYVPPKPAGYWQTAAAAGKALIQTTYRYGTYGLAKLVAENPAKILERIHSTAQKGLNRAAEARGVEIKSEAEAAEAAQRIFNLNTGNESTVRNASAVGPIADISPFPPDPQVTRAPNLQARVEDTNWEERMAFHADRLIDKTTAFITLSQMCTRCGIDTENKLPLMSIVKKFTESNHDRKTLWELFTERYPLSLIQKLKAGWFYCLYYLTSLVTNTVRAYLETTIKSWTEDLVNDDKRSLVFNKLLENTNHFLEKDITATRKFAEEGGVLKDIRNRAIEEHYNFSFPELCKAFSNKKVDQDKTTVPILRAFQTIPLIGLAFKAFEDFVNRYIIRSAMKTLVLPFAVESTVKSGLEATQPHNLPFKISLIQFLISRLTELKTQLDSKSPSPRAEEFSGTEGQLTLTIKNLMTVLELDPFKTSFELNKKFQEIKKGKWVWDRKVEDGIKDGINNGANALFEYLNNTVKSKELFAHLLKLSCDLFSGEGSSKTQFLAEMEKLDDLFEVVGEKIVNDALGKKFSGIRPQVSKKVAEKTFESEKAVANNVFAELKNISDRMSEKIERSARNPTVENNTQQDIVLFLEIMKAFASRKEIQQKIDKLDLNGVDRHAIWRLMEPLYQKAYQIEQRILKLQELQNDYPSHATVENQLKLINDLFRSIRDRFHTQPRHLQNPLIQTLGKAAEEISNCLGSKADVPRISQQYIKQIAELSESIAKRQKMIDAICAFYPPRLKEQDVEAEGLLDQLLNYERGIHPPGFKPRACLAEIGEYLEHFPPEEKKELEILIGNGSNLKSKWNQLGAILQRIYQQHMDLKNRDKVQLDRVLDQATEWTQDKILKFSVLKEKDHSKMQNEMRLISQEVIILQNEALNAELHIPASISKKGVSGSLFSLILGGAGGLMLGPPGAVAGAGMGAVIGEIIHAHPDEKRNFSVVKATAGLIGGIASSAYGGAYWTLGAAAGSAAVGLYGRRAFQTGVQWFVQPKVMKIFKSACERSLKDPLIYKAAATRLLKELS